MIMIGVKILCNACEKEMTQNGPMSKVFICANCLTSVTIVVVTAEGILR
jgi:hypothetical protein